MNAASTLAFGAYVAFGPADPTAQKSLMGGADVAVVGFANNTAGSAFIRDFYLRDYLPCRVDAESGAVVGACADSVWAGGGWNASLSASETVALAAIVDNWVLTGASVSSITGVATIRFRRDVNTTVG